MVDGIKTWADEDKNIIYIEDDQDLGEIISDFLRFEGYVPHKAANAAGGVELLKQSVGKNLVGVISDCDMPTKPEMPVKEGAVAIPLTYMLDHGILVPTILTSGRDYNHLAERMKVDFIPKDPTELKKMTNMTYPSFLIDRFNGSVLNRRAIVKPNDYHSYGISY